MTRLSFRIAVPLSLAFALFCARDATADGFDAERFAPAVGAAGGFSTESPVVPFHFGFGVGLFLDFADDPVQERDAVTDVILSKPLDTSLSTNLLASLGLWDRFEVGLHLPLHLIYEGDDFVAGTTNLSASAGLGDIRLYPKVTLWGGGNAEKHALLGLSLPISFPSGDEEALRGDGGLSIEPRILFAAYVGAWGILANLGYRYRSEHPADLPWGDELAFAIAGVYELTPTTSITAELFGGQQVATEIDDGDLMLEGLAGITYMATENWSLYGGASLGLIDGLGEPDFRLIGGVRYTKGMPERHGFADSDGDGIVDRDDDCPQEAEDMDGFADDDGCPEPDNDRDGIMDADDECPDMPEEPGGDGDGCPSRTYVKVANGKIEIFGKVQFETGSDRVKKKSEPLLDQIATALRGNKQIKKVRVEGHTDNVGDDEMNQELSERRARSVRAALVRRGIDEDRLEAKGYGEKRPIAPNSTKPGRAKNRRVEFVVVE